MRVLLWLLAGVLIVGKRRPKVSLIVRLPL